MEDARKFAKAPIGDTDIEEEGVYDVTIATLRNLVEVIKAQWAGPNEDRIEHTRCGTIYLDDDKMGFKLHLRFPLDEETWQRLNEGENPDLNELWRD